MYWKSLMWSKCSRRRQTSRSVSKISVRSRFPSPAPPTPTPCCSTTPTTQISLSTPPNSSWFQSSPNYLGFGWKSGWRSLFASSPDSPPPGSRASRWCRSPGSPAPEKLVKYVDDYGWVLALAKKWWSLRWQRMLNSHSQPWWGSGVCEPVRWCQNLNPSSQARLLSQSPQMTACLACTKKTWTQISISDTGIN